jgi:hypothetical protein
MAMTSALSGEVLMVQAPSGCFWMCRRAWRLLKAA